ncbi:MAG: hypothetical protein U0L67_02805 [Paludibacteraceae bacterium]|nr:hypothetical protein [Paludibacteraceae bacterium]
MTELIAPIEDKYRRHKTERMRLAPTATTQIYNNDKPVAVSSQTKLT